MGEPQTQEQRLIRMFESYLARGRRPASDDWTQGYNASREHVRQAWAEFKADRGLPAPSWSKPGDLGDEIRELSREIDDLKTGAGSSEGQPGAFAGGAATALRALDEGPISSACKLCGRPRRAFQVFCGAACSERWEAGERA